MNIFDKKRATLNQSIQRVEQLEAEFYALKANLDTCHNDRETIKICQRMAHVAELFNSISTQFEVGV